MDLIKIALVLNFPLIGFLQVKKPIIVSTGLHNYGDWKDYRINKEQREQ